MDFIESLVYFLKNKEKSFIIHLPLKKDRIFWKFGWFFDIECYLIITLNPYVFNPNLNPNCLFNTIQNFLLKI